MIDFEPILLAQYTDDDGLRTLIKLGLKDENVALLGEGDEALKVWQFAKAYYQRKSKAPPEKVLFEEFEQYLVTTRDKGDEEVEDLDLAYVVNSLQRNYLYEKSRELITSATFSREIGMEEAREQVRSLGQEILRVTMDSSVEEPLQSMADLLPSFLDNTFHFWEKIESGEAEKPITFGFKHVDDAYLGIAKGELATLFAYSGMGKSFLACKCALSAVLQGKKVALWSLENSLEETMIRLSALAGRLPYDHVQNKVLAPVERQKLSALLDEEQLSRLYIKQPVSAEGSTLEEIYWESKALGVDLIVGDQLSHVHHPGKKGDPDWLNETNKLRYARNLSGVCDVASIWAAQANVKAHGKAKLDLTMIARSQGYIQGSDFVFGITGDKATTIRRFEALKSRRGPETAWQMAFNYAPMDIETTTVVT